MQTEAVAGLGKPQRGWDEAELSRAPCISHCKVTLALPLSCLSHCLLCVALCQVFVKHIEPLPPVFSFVFSLPLPLSVSLPVFLVTRFLLFFLFPLKFISVQWIFALLCTHTVRVVPSIFSFSLPCQSTHIYSYGCPCVYAYTCLCARYHMLIHRRDTEALLDKGS